MDDMKTRFTLYGFGFVIGLVLVFFFLGGKKSSCNWMPNDRILNIIAQKKIQQQFIKTRWIFLIGVPP